MKQEGVDEERAATEERPAREGGVTVAAQRAADEMESPVSDTIHNLVQTLSVKLDSAYRYGIYQQDAIREGHEDCAQVFADISRRERETIDRLVRCLQDRIGDVPVGTTRAGRAGVAGSEGTAAGDMPEASDPLSEPATPSAPTAPQVPGAEPGPGPQSPRMP
jgi:hypothetical protein